MDACYRTTVADARALRALSHAIALCGLLAISSLAEGFPPGQTYSMATVDTAAALLEQARVQDQFGQGEAVDSYFRAAAQASELLGFGSWLRWGGDDVNAIYNEAVAGLINAGQRYGRLDPRGHLIVVIGGRPVVVPIEYEGFAWHPRDFSRLTPAKEFSNNKIKQQYLSAGVGVPLVVERFAPACPGSFLEPWQPFGATALLSRGAESSSGYVLSLCNPLGTDSATINGARFPLARDLTAPLAAIVNEVPRQYLQGFLAPADTASQPKLVMLEPYQPGKIPVVFIHGLYSDPITWVDMINSLRAQSDIYDQFQIWTFRYPTGGNLLESAADLRRMLAQVRAAYDPLHVDPAMGNVVLVGHSLGGLMSKLQVTQSGDQMWQAIAVGPFAEVQASQSTLVRLSQAMFFEPVPFVSRVVFIGTPHRGSNMAQRVAGRVGSSLVSFGSQEDTVWQELVDDNRSVFREEVSDRRPTTIDFLEPENPLLMGLERLPINGSVRLNSIIGTGRTKPLAGPGDGVVSVDSAMHCGDSTFFVDTTHEELHKVPESIDEVARILRLHAGTVR